MKQILGLCLLFGLWLFTMKACTAHADEPKFKIAIIDTGYDPTRVDWRKLKLCDHGHFDYFTNTANLNFVSPHGTWVASIIAEKLKKVDYCAVVYQVAPSGGSPDRIFIPTTNIADAVNRAIGEGVVAINISLASSDEANGKPDQEERQALEYASQAHIAIFVSAGNRGLNLDKRCSVYPACYKGIKNMIVVGSTSETDKKSPAIDSNYGKVVSIWAQGFYEDGDVTETGTSFAVPRALSEYVLYLDSHKKH